MQFLYVFFDEKCGLCRKSRMWLDMQPKFFELRFLPYQSDRAREIFPALDQFDPAREIVVVDDGGNVYQGGRAWIMCLYALREYRELSLKLAHPALLPLAKRICALVSANRLKISSLLGRGENEIARDLGNYGPDNKQAKAKIR